MSTSDYDLDENVKETFKFTLKGVQYEFRQMTTEEIDKFSKIKDDIEIRQHLFEFVTPVDPESESFEQASKKMTAPHWKNFVKMIRTEMGAE